MRTTDITPGVINWEEVPFCDLTVSESEKYLLHDGDVVISRAGSVGYSFLLRNPQRSVFASYLIRFRPRINPEFLSYFLNTPAYWDAIGERSLGIAVQNVNASTLSGIELPLPPAAEQTRIVEKLEELLSDLDAGVAELKAAQKKLIRYRQSLLKAAVEGELTAQWRAAQSSGQLGAPAASAESGAALLARILTERRSRWETRQLARFQAQGKTPPKDWQAKYPVPVAPDTAGLPALPQGWVWASVDQLSPDDLANGRSVLTAESGAKVLRLTAVKHGRIDLGEYKIGAWSVDEAKPFAVVQGDLLIVRGNGSLTLVGKAGMVPSVTEQVAYPDTMIRLRLVDSVVRPEWVGLLWDASITRSHLEKRARTSAGIYKISQPDIVSVVIPVPPLNEQDLMLSMFKQTSEEMQVVQAMVERGLKQSAAQRKNILQAAFSGQFVPQDPADEPASALLARIRAGREVRASSAKAKKSKPSLTRSPPC